MATATAKAYAAGYAAGWRACVENNTHEEDEDENLLLPTKKPPAPPAALCTSSPPPPPPPPPLLALLEQVPDLFSKEVLARLTPTDRALLGRASRACRAIVVESTALKAQQAAAAAELAVEQATAALKAQTPGLTGAGFISADSFEGPKEGYIFRMDGAGLGYYVDNQALRSSLDLALTRKARAGLPPPPSLPFRASNFAASFELSVWAVANGCTWMQMTRAVEAKEAAEAAAAAQAAAELAAAAAAAEKATADAAAAELSACVEAAFRAFNDLDVDGTGVHYQEVYDMLSDRFDIMVRVEAVNALHRDGHIEEAPHRKKEDTHGTTFFRVCYDDNDQEDDDGDSDGEEEWDTDSETDEAV
jgi:hypothetical protein